MSSFRSFDILKVTTGEETEDSSGYQIDDDENDDMKITLLPKEGKLN